MVGYTYFGYNILIENKVIEVRHEEIVKNSSKLICLHCKTLSNENHANLNLSESDDEQEINVND